TLGGNLALSKGTLGMAALGLNVGGNITQAGGLVSSTGTVTLNGSTGVQTVDLSTSTLANLTVSNSFSTPTVNASGTITLGGNLALSAGTLAMAGNGLNVAGNITRGTGLITSTGTVTLDGSAAQGVDFTSSTLTNLTVNNSGITLGGNLALSKGTLGMAALGLNVGGNITQAGGLVSSTGTVTLDGSTGVQTVDLSTSTLANLTVSNSFSTPTVNASGTITLGGNLALSAGTLAMAGNGLNVAGNITRGTGLITST